MMKFALVFVFTFLAIPGYSQDTTTAKSFFRDGERDTILLNGIPEKVYNLSPVTINPMEAHERETPATFVNLSRRELNERYSFQDVPLILSDLPSTTFYSENGNGIGYNYINLRGFDQRRISVMINGVPQNDPEDHNVYWIDFPDLMGSTENIQVQRGAGSAFYGPPAIGGSVNLVSTPSDPKQEITLESMIGVQEYGTSSTIATRKYTATINSGLIDNQYLLYGRLGKIQSAGYRENSWVELSSYFLGVVRFDKDFTTRIHFFGGPLTDALAYNGLPKFVNNDTLLRRQNLSSWTTDSTGTSYTSTQQRRPQETESYSQPHYEMLNEWRISPTVTLNSTLFLYQGEGYFDYDASWADTSMLRIGTAYRIPVSQNPANTLVRAFVGNKQWGWLPRVEFEHEHGKLTAGAELRIHRSTHWGKISFAEALPANFDPEYHFYEYNGEKDIVSGYVQELYRPENNISVMADLQFVHNRYGIANEKYLRNNFNYYYFFVNPRIGINYNVDEKFNTYISVAYTSREPRLRNLYAAEDSYFGATPQFHADTAGGTVRYDFNNPFAQPEQLLDIEFGSAYRDKEVKLSWNFFWMEFCNELVENGQVDIFGQPITGNAERTRHLGVEVDGAWNIHNTFHSRYTISGNFSLFGNRLIRSSVVDNGSPVTLDGNPISGFPDAMANFRVTVREDALTMSLNVKHVGSFFTDNFMNAQHQNDAYTVADVQVLYDLPVIFGTTFTLRGEEHNIADKLFFTNGEGDAFFPAAERNYIFGITAHL
jgi:iron complex outermembrane receptor protein